ncbi:MAG: LysR family transcriptional regulator [Planctomycetia bacterium]|nr:LysR family transcriptional regulator [Planctomycetia bacterium]
MSIESFRIFCDVVSSKSFSRGASANNVSQSAATQTVHRLEKQLDTRLIDRTKRPFVLTPEGEICYEGFREILETYDTVATRIRSLHDQVGGLIRVAAIYSVGIHEMSRCMRNFMKAYPKVNIRLEYLHPHRVYQAVLDSEVDLGVVSYPTASPEINVIPLRSEEMAVIVPVGHPLANEKSLELEQLEGVDYVAFNRELIIRRETDRHMRQRNIHVNIIMEFDNIETIKQAIEVGLGVSILPIPTVASDVESGKMIAVPLVSPQLTRPIGIIHRHRKVFTTTMSRFVEMLSGGYVANGANATDTDINEQNEPQD